MSNNKPPNKGTRNPTIIEMLKGRKIERIGIPVNVYFCGWNNNRKILFTEIDSLDNGIGCTAGDDHLAGRAQIGASTVRRMVASFVKEGYLRKSYLYNKDGSIMCRVLNVIAEPEPMAGEPLQRPDGFSEIDKALKLGLRIIREVPFFEEEDFDAIVDLVRGDQNEHTPCSKRSGPPAQNERLSNTSIDKEPKNKEQREIESPALSADDGKLKKRLGKLNAMYLDDVKEVVEYFIEKTGKEQTKPWTKGVYNMVVRWLKEGNTVEDIKLVIDYKVYQFTEVIPHPENIVLLKFLRPEKFEGNLIEAREWREKPKAAAGPREIESEEYLKLWNYVSASPVLVDSIPPEKEYLDFLDAKGKYAGRFKESTERRDRKLALVHFMDEIANGSKRLNGKNFVDALMATTIEL